MPPTSMSERCRRLVTEPSEGKRLVAYRDCVGVWTIGYGHTTRAGSPAVTPGMRIANAQADAILSKDLAVFEAGVAAATARAKGGVAQCEFDALVDLAFNIGLGAFRSSSLLRVYLAGDKARAAQKFLDWNKAGGRVVPGLVARRKRERAWFLTGRLPGEPPPSNEAAANAPAPATDHPDPPHARAVNLVQLEGTLVMKGYRTIIAGLVLAIGPVALQYLGAVDWAQIIGPTGAFFVSGVIAIVMRSITTTPVGKPDAGTNP